MATSVQVLCPNGRRQNVKVTPNTKLMQVLEEVCTKQSFLPPEDYDLISGRKTVDLTLAFRFANLPNNAKLELTKSATPRAQAEVTIALQLQDGDRLQHAFQATTSLWDMLEHMESQNEKYRGKLTFVDSSQSPPLHPVCIYMTDEVVGEPALKHTTLKKLALTSGKAIIRFIHRPVDDNTFAGIINKIEQEKSKQAKLAKKNQLPSSASSQTSTSVDGTPSISSTGASLQETSFEQKMNVDEPVKVTQDEAAKETGDKNTAASLEEPMDVEHFQGQALGSSVSKKGGTSSVNASSSEVSRPSTENGATGLSAIEQLRRMNIPGVEIITPRDFNDLTPEQQQVARALAEQFMPGVLGGGQQQGAGPKPKKPKAAPHHQPFADFKFPEETKGQDLYRNELSTTKHEEYRPCEREAIIFDSNEENTSKAVTEDIPDDFFEVTDVDVKSLYKGLQKQAACDRPLMTESMRQAELEERHEQYHHIVMRIQFHDGLVLQGCFRPRETVFALHKFVKEHLEDKGQNFCLYRTPPKQILSDMSMTLVQADLAPASLVFFGSDKKEEHSLVTSARQEIASKRSADELSVKKLAKKQMELLAAESSSSTDTLKPSPSSSHGQGQGGGGARGAGRFDGSAVSRTSAAVTSSDTKVPKWLKIGKK